MTTESVWSSLLNAAGLIGASPRLRPEIKHRIRARSPRGAAVRPRSGPGWGVLQDGYHGRHESDHLPFPAHGLPQHLYMDNGKDYRSHVFAGAG